MHARWAGIKSEFGQLDFHEIRKSCAQNWADSGLPINVTKEFLGHADVATTTKHYSKVDALHMDFATKVMNEMIAAAEQKALDAQLTQRGENIKKKDDKGLKNASSSVVSHALENTSGSA